MAIGIRYGLGVFALLAGFDAEGASPPGPADPEEARLVARPLGLHYAGQAMPRPLGLYYAGQAQLGYAGTGAGIRGQASRSAGDSARRRAEAGRFAGPLPRTTDGTIGRNDRRRGQLREGRDRLQGLRQRHDPKGPEAP